LNSVSVSVFFAAAQASFGALFAFSNYAFLWWCQLLLLSKTGSNERGAEQRGEK
jgi:hypothetical protein